MKRNQLATFITILIAFFMLALVTGFFLIVSNYQQAATTKLVKQTDTIELGTPAKAILDAENYPYVFVNDLFPNQLIFRSRKLELLREEHIPPAQAAIQMASLAEKCFDKNFTNTTTLVWLEYAKHYGDSPERLCWEGVVGYDTSLQSFDEVSSTMDGYSNGSVRARVSIDAITGAIIYIESYDNYQWIKGESRADGDVTLDGQLLFSYKDTADIARRTEKLIQLTEQRSTALLPIGTVKNISAKQINYYDAATVCEKTDGSRLVFSWRGVSGNDDYTITHCYLQTQEHLAAQIAEAQYAFDLYGPPLIYSQEQSAFYNDDQRKVIDLLTLEVSRCEQSVYEASDANRAERQRLLDDAITKRREWALANVPREFWPEGVK